MALFTKKKSVLINQFSAINTLSQPLFQTQDHFIKPLSLYNAMTSV